MIYFDSAYLAKCYLPEPGYRVVRSFAESAGRLTSVAFARIEVAAVFHRHLREGRLRPVEHKEFALQFVQDCTSGIVSFLPLTPKLLEAAQSVYQSLPASVFLRSADCLHLVAAREAGFAEIYSNDPHLLAATVHFGLKGIDLTATS